MYEAMGIDYNAFTIIGWYFTAEELATKFPITCNACRLASDKGISTAAAEDILLKELGPFEAERRPSAAYCTDDPEIFEDAFSGRYLAKYGFQYHRGYDCRETPRHFISLIQPIEGDTWNVKRYPLSQLQLPPYSDFMNAYQLPEPSIICVTNVC